MVPPIYKTPPPRLCAKFQNTITKKAIEVWTTSCIVTNFKTAPSAPSASVSSSLEPSSACRILVNPSNPELSGVSKFSYFPRGGPVPQLSKAMSNNSWGGLEAGDQMLYPVQVVDGIVHQLGGKELASECEKIRALYEQSPIPFGSAVSTSGGNEKLQREYDQIIHVMPPFFNRAYNNNSNGIRSDEDPVELLRRCYVEAISLAFNNLTLTSDHIPRSHSIILASPLIGAGARGFPSKIALEVAASQTCLWMDTNTHHLYVDGNNADDDNNDGDPSNATNIVDTIAFGIPNSISAETLVNMIAEQTKIEKC